MPHARSRHIKDATFAAVVRSFMSDENPAWRGYAEATRDLWGRELRLAQLPETLGALSIYAIRPSLVQAFLDGLSDRPAKQTAALSALRAVDKWAVRRDRLPHSITFGLEAEESDGGHIPWTDEQVMLAEQRARPDLAKAITLGAATGQRGSDLVRMGPTDLEEHGGRLGVNVRQKKTGRVVWVPFTNEFLAVFRTWPRTPGPFLRKPDGVAAWTRKALTDAWSYERDGNPALAPLREVEVESTQDKGLVLHGLRGTACVRLLRAGCATRQISDMVGMSEPMVAKYCRFSLQRENALAAVTMLDRTTRERLLEKRTGVDAK